MVTGFGKPGVVAEAADLCTGSVTAGPFGEVRPAGDVRVEAGSALSIALTADHTLGAVSARNGASVPEIRFLPGQAFDAGDSRGVALGDVDGDGDLDAVVTCDSSPNRVWLNGEGQFVAGAPFGDSEDVSRGVALGDLDGDGDPDVVVAHLGRCNEVYLNDGEGVFNEKRKAMEGASNMSLAVGLADLDGDGDLDAFVANYGQSNQVWLNDGAGEFVKGETLPGGLKSMALDLGDLDGDGDVDACVVNREGGNRVWINNGAGGFGYRCPDATEFSSRGVALGDLDGDGDSDAFVVNARGQQNLVRFNDGGGNFIGDAQTLGHSNSVGVKLGDFDGDGDLDAFVINEMEPGRVWVNDGGGAFSDGGLALEAGKSTALELGDLDGDGDLDVFVVRGQNAGIAQSDLVLLDRTGQYEVAFSVSGDVGGVLSGDLEQVVWHEGSSSSVEAIPAEGKCFAGWVEGDGRRLSDNPLVLEDVRSDVDVEAVFEVATFSVVASAGLGGTICPTGERLLSWGEDLTVQIAADEGYEIADVTVDGSSVGAVSSCTFSDVRTDHEILVTFEPEKFTVKATSGPGGSVSPNGIQVVSWGEDLTIDVLPCEGFVLSSLTVDGGIRNGVSQVIFENIRADHELEALFDLDTEKLDDAGVGDVRFPDVSASDVDQVSEGLPVGVALVPVTSEDLEALSFRAVDLAEALTTVDSGDMAAHYLAGLSFDVKISNLGEGESPDVLAFDLDVVLPETSFSVECLDDIEGISDDEGFELRLIDHISLLKVVSGELWDLRDLVTKNGDRLEDFLTVSRDREGDFLLNLKLWVVDGPLDGGVSVQAVSGDPGGRFLIFDGCRDGHFKDPVIILERRASADENDDWGCSLIGVFPMFALLILPLFSSVLGLEPGSDLGS